MNKKTELWSVQYIDLENKKLVKHLVADSIDAAINLFRSKYKFVKIEKIEIA